jgi:hypothetical protein
MIRCTPLFVAVLAVALAGCSEDSAENTTDAAAGPATRASPDPALAAPQIRQPLAAEDIEMAALAGELACSFTQRGAEGPLLVASADVTDQARADGVLRLGPSTLRLQGVEAGGFNAIIHGARFTSGELEARVVVTSETPTGDGESPPLPARLEIGSPAGTQRIDGEWTCGP